MPAINWLSYMVQPKLISLRISTISHHKTFTYKAAKAISNRYAKTNIPSQVLNNFQIFFQIYHLY